MPLRSPLRVVPAVALLPLGAWSSAAAAQCVDSATTAALVVVLEDAEAAYGRLELEAFQSATDEAASMIPCLEAVVPRATAARYHRVQGLRAWLVRDEERAQQTFLAARLIERAYRFPVELVPEEHPTRQAYMAMALDQVVTEPVAVPEGASLVVDGRETGERPVNLPALLQLVDGEGALRWSVYADPGTALPPWPLDLVAEPQARDRWRAPLILGSVGAAVVSGTLVGLAGSAAQRYADPATPVDQLDGLRARTNGLLVGASVAGGVAAGAAVGAAWTFR
ncbi:hypothetical protein L6R53_25835 [Myxococcota bacterium]|nr:hypothetical protein [Myxococcota bacterium]